MNLQARELRYFLALSETLSFTEAAKRCEISQPALTRAIKGLEEKLGGRALVHREKGHTHLSPLGLAMKPYFEAVLNELQSAKEEARTYREKQRQALRLGVLNTLEPTVFSRFLETQTADANKLAIELHESTAPNCPKCCGAAISMSPLQAAPTLTRKALSSYPCLVKG